VRSVAQVTRALVILGALPVAATPSEAQSGWSGDRPDARIPLGVPGQYELSTGQLALSYQYSRDYFSDYRSEAFSVILEPVSAEELLADWPTVPKRMRQHSHVFGAAFAPLDGVVVTARLPLHSYGMDVLTDSVSGYSQASSGIGDLSVAGSYRVLSWARQRFDVHFGAGFPTGSLDSADAALDSLPYAMRFASGTWVWSPGFTYLGQGNGVSWGFQLYWSFPVGANARNYRLGGSHHASTWLAGTWADWISSSVRLAYRSWGAVDGYDPALDPDRSPLEDVLTTSGRYVDGWIGTNLRIPSGPLAGHGLSVEVGYPLYIQVSSLRSRWYLTAGWQYTFRLLDR
jgi:hypothetical protein